jgi:hypothetical protein
MKLILSLFLFSALAQAAPVTQTNGCLSRGVYRALTGADVAVDSTGRKQLIFNGKTLFDCNPTSGKTASCSESGYGYPWSNSNYDCSINFQNLSGNAAQFLMQNTTFDKGFFLSGLNLALTENDHYTGACNARICISYNVLECDKVASTCLIKTEVDSYNP